MVATPPPEVPPRPEEPLAYTGTPPRDGSDADRRSPGI